jgi:murein DD-endopeptidase MepM/ murein hydrolase activator NlpD
MADSTDSGQQRRTRRTGRFTRGDESRYGAAVAVHTDSLDPPPWVAPEPADPPPRRARQPAPRRRPSRVGPVAGSLVLGVITTAVLTVIGGLPLTTLGSGDGVRSHNAAAIGSTEAPTSQAITSESGPVHPLSGPIDYGDGEARFGAPRYGHVHEGQDMFGKSGTPLLAVRDATVIERGNDGGRGNYIAIYNEAEDQTYVYLHMLRPSGLKRGERVGAGEPVGAMGCTGSCYGVHLHFEVRLGRGVEKKPIDPLPMLKRWPQIPEPE